MMDNSVKALPYPERLRLYEAAKNALTGLTAAEYQDAIRALADYFGI